MPAPAPSRIAALDVARGLAILGTLATNIWIFSHQGGFLGYLTDPLAGTAGGAARAAQALLMAAANGKFLGLLMLLFGIGLAVQHASARRRGLAWPRSYRVRAGILFLDGLLNYLLIIEFDVLMGYALTGMVVAWLVTTSERVQRGVVLACAAAHVAVIGALTAVLVVVPAGDPAEALARPNPYADGTWWELVLLRVDAVVLFRAEPVLILGLGVVMFLAGRFLWRAGLLVPDGGRWRRRLMVLGLGVALPVDLGLNVLGGQAGAFFARYTTAPVVALGLLALVAHLGVRRPGQPPSWAARRLAEVGRTALSCYLLQNLLASALFYGWGAGLAVAAAQHRLPATVLGWLVVCAAVLVFAHLWLRRFPRGPLEELTARAAGARRAPAAVAREG